MPNIGFVEQPTMVDCATCEHYRIINKTIESTAPEPQIEFTCSMCDPYEADSCFIFKSMHSSCIKWEPKDQKQKEEEDKTSEIRDAVEKLIDENEHQRRALCNIQLELDGAKCDND